ncbi:hypothetical protein KKG83_08035 [Candidatus Micrarchaeota archaeon]|nr:hypothetical protein [Candidatus Micrarchaeota archaeon]MBU2477390.1 hypothetical protein [Candidatus Micrarchaeota archaeon]
MFNKFFLVLISLLFFASFSYSLKIVSPVEAEVLPGSTIELGKISPGQSFELIVLGEEVNSLELSGQFSEWADSFVFYEKNTGIKINVPLNASLGTKNLSFNAFNSSDPASSAESFNVLINVQNDLWSVSISDLSRTAKVGIPAEYSLVLSNESIGKQKIELSSDLPSYWMQKKTFELDSKSVLRDKIEVSPKHYGKREFSFVFSSLYSSESKKFNSRMSVESSLSSKYSSPSYGFPFFTPVLLSYYFAESVLSLLVQPFLSPQ